LGFFGFLQVSSGFFRFLRVSSGFFGFLPEFLKSHPEVVLRVIYDVKMVLGRKKGISLDGIAILL
jgi:hypothetical protein